MFKELTGGAFYESPSFQVALFSIILAFVLSSVMAFTFHFTSKGSAFSRNFFQAMVLSSIVTCLVIMAVGDNIAAGFGVIGAIAIIRFRMRIENPRNIIFIFASLSVGIASGVHGYSIALAGTIAFCSIAYLLYLSPYGGRVLASEFNLTFTISKSVDKRVIEDFLIKACHNFRLLGISGTKKGDRYNYFITLSSDLDKEIFYKNISEIEGVVNVGLDRSDNLERI
jgi:uncharacterized membrane protein YhiD involved in acid resistance